MQRVSINLRDWAPIAVAVLAVLLIVGLFGNGARTPAAIDPAFGLNALAGLFNGAIDLTIGLLPIVLVAVFGFFLVRWWLAADDATAVPRSAALGTLFAATPRREVACPNCATPVQDGWQACPSCGYRMHVINAAPVCGQCHHPVDRAWSVCPHCAAALPKAPDEQRVPARQMVEAARQYNMTRAAALPTVEDTREAA